MAESQGELIREAAALVEALAKIRSPRIVLIVRKAYGAAHAIFITRLAADQIYAWSSAEIGLMGSAGAREILSRQGVDPQDCARLLPNLDDAKRQGAIGRIVLPSETRAALLAALDASPALRG